jgi:hypothetical protein
MYGQSARRLGALFTAIVCVSILTRAAFAGIPEPGVILYGQVLDDTGRLVTAGHLTFTYAPEDGGEPLVVGVDMAELDGVGGPYSYRIMIPFETAVEGFPVSSNALELGAVPEGYVRTINVAGAEISMTHALALSRADRGTALRVDVCATCDVQTKIVHSADVNKDFKFSLGEFLRVVELHGATPGHDYSTNVVSEDGYSVGTGPQAGTPHSSDFDGTSDWRISMKEVLRMIDLFTSTEDHSYSPDPTGDDGFRKGDSAFTSVANKSLSVVGDAGSNLVVQREAVGGQVPGQIEFTVRIDDLGDSDLSALGLIERLPDGWSVSKFGGSSIPFLASDSNSGMVEFAFYPAPAFPLTFSYTVDVNLDGNVATAFKSLSGGTVYRSMSKRGAVEIPFQSGYDALTDTDGDGIPDAVEGWGDADGDSMPDFLDFDSDNDGLSDYAEAFSDGVAGYNPFHAANNPEGTDTSATLADTDGDGLSDADEVSLGLDPLNPADSSAVSAQGPLVLLLAMFMVLTLGVTALRRGQGEKIHAYLNSNSRK